MTAAVQEPVAIVGMAVLLPGAPDLASYWSNLTAGTDAITDLPAGRWDESFYDPTGATGVATPDHIYCRRGGFVDDLVDVEPTRFGIMPSSVAGAEPDQLIALQVAAAAIDDAGGSDWLPDRDRVGIVLGRGGYLTPGLVRLDQRVRTAHQLVHTLRELLPEITAYQLAGVRDAFVERLGPDQPDAAIGLVPNLAASRVANRLDLRGPAFTVDAACASSLLAVDQAVSELTSRRCDVVLAGGVHHCHDVTMWSVFAQLRALSPTQQIRPFHRDADGLLIGEGTGVVVLKRLADAQRDGDRIYAVVSGTGVASDGRTAGLANPDPAGQTRAVRAAWRAAGLDPTEPGSVGLVEAHGTATPAGDAAELSTLAAVFGSAGRDGERAVLGSVKSMIGHTMPAAGVAGLVKAALAVHHGVLLPTLHCDDPHPGLAATRFRTTAVPEPWQPGVSGPRRAGVNAFGFGGINAHVVVEQAQLGSFSPAASALRPRAATAPLPHVAVIEPERVLLLQRDHVSAFADLLAGSDADILAAPTGPTGPVRLAIVDPTEKRLALARRAVARGGAWRGRNDLWFSPSPLLGSTSPGKIAFLFPGLEGEFAPLVDDVIDHFRLGRPAAADTALVGDVGRHGVGVVTLGRTLDAAMRAIGVSPDAVAGHSVGEWTAMSAGGIWAREDTDAFIDGFDPDALQVPGLAFAVVGAPSDRVATVLEGWPEVVISHDNAPRQSIVCGPTGHVDELVLAFRAQGVIAQVLPFQSGFHTPMLEPYLAPLTEAANRLTLHQPSVPVWSATTAAPFPSAPAEVRTLFVRHLLETVRFRPMVEAMYADGFRAFVQLGVGQLGSLVSDSLSGKEHLVVAADSPSRPGLAQLRRVAAALWTEGAAPDFAALEPTTRGTTGSSVRRHQSVRLDLSGALISLDSAAALALGASLRTTLAPSSPTPVLTSLAGSSPVFAEFEALLRDTHDAAAELVAAVSAPTTTRAPERGTQLLHVSVDTMPWLLDHCFFRQAPGWPHLADRWPIVPATAIVERLIDAAQAGGRQVQSVGNVRFGEWVQAAEPHDVEISLEPLGVTGNELTAEFGRFARGELELTDAYAESPPVWRVDAATERAPEHAARHIYDQRWMFHGPAYQGVTELTAVGDRHVRGVLTAPAAPGGLLDNVGQLLGYWVMASFTTGTIVFPVGMAKLCLFGAPPAPGSTLDCHIVVTELTDTAVVADVQLSERGRVWAEIRGWRDRRFDSNPATQPAERFTDRNTHSALQPGGWMLLADHWPDLASRDLATRAYLATPERFALEARPPRGRRSTLLGRIAVKDAVRQHVWARGAGPVFPAEIEVGNEASGRPTVAGVHGRTLPDLAVSLAHTGPLAVALVRGATDERGATDATGVGIDLTLVTTRDPETLEVALGEAERTLLTELATDGDHDLWFARFWAAKEAVAKAAGTGLSGRPRDFRVVEAEDSGVLVEVSGATHAVACTEIQHAGLRYVVAWTAERNQIRMATS